LAVSWKKKKTLNFEFKKNGLYGHNEKNIANNFSIYASEILEKLKYAKFFNPNDVFKQEKIEYINFLDLKNIVNEMLNSKNLSADEHREFTEIKQNCDLLESGHEACLQIINEARSKIIVVV